MLFDNCSHLNVCFLLFKSPHTLHHFLHNIFQYTDLKVEMMENNLIIIGLYSLRHPKEDNFLFQPLFKLPPFVNYHFTVGIFVIFKPNTNVQENQRLGYFPNLQLTRYWK